MEERIAVVGSGSTKYEPETEKYSWKELMYQAASKAYEDAGLNPRKDIDSFVTCAEDYWEGFSIFDEFVPDQLGAVLKPTCTVCGDGLHGLAVACMQIMSGMVDVVAVEAHSKISDLTTYNDVVLHAFDPVYNKPLAGHPYYVAGMEMNKFLEESGNTEEQCASVVQKNMANALRNPLAPYGRDVGIDEVMGSEPMFSPAKKLDISRLADGSVVLVLASAEKAKCITDEPVWISGFGWNSETPWLEGREWGRASYAEDSSKMAYEMAGIVKPHNEIDFAEVDDKFSYKELMHIEALGLAEKGQGGKDLENGRFHHDGDLPINISGGSLGCGNLLEASGLHRALEVVLQLRGNVGERQLKEAERGLAQSWRGVPTASGAVVIFER
ncbi:MAG: acetyl-CoA acetyltransferase [Thermoplasmata archaeon]